MSSACGARALCSLTRIKGYTCQIISTYHHIMCMLCLDTDRTIIRGANMFKCISVVQLQSDWGNYSCIGISFNPSDCYDQVMTIFMYVDLGPPGLSSTWPAILIRLMNNALKQITFHPNSTAMAVIKIESCGLSGRDMLPDTYIGIALLYCYSGEVFSC